MHGARPGNALGLAPGSHLKIFDAYIEAREQLEAGTLSAQEAMSTSDFPTYMGSLIRLSFLDRFTEISGSWGQYTRDFSLEDFETWSMARWGRFPDIEEKQRLAADQVREAFASSGLPPVTQKRLIASYEGIEEFDKTKVEKDIADAKEELKAAGAGPVITGMGPSGGTGEQSQKPTYSVKESVMEHFAGKKPAKSDDSHEKKES